MNLENIATVQVDSGAGHVHKWSGWRRSIGIFAGGIHAFSSIAVEIEFDGDARWDAAGAPDGIRSVSEPTAAWSQGRRRAAPMNGECETIRVRIG